MTKTILYLEDDRHAVKFMLPQFAKYGTVDVVDTEYGFRQYVKDAVEKRKNWPDVVVLDQRVPWAHEVVESPAEVEEQGMRYAGIRCYEYLREIEHEQGRAVTPTILFSIADKSSLETMLKEKGHDMVSEKSIVGNKGEFIGDALHVVIRELLDK